MKIKTKKSSLIFILFITTNILFIFLQIHKQSYIVKFHYEKQRLEKEKDLLIQKKNSLNHQLYELKNPANILNYAIEKLGMLKTKLTQTGKIKIND